MRLRRSDVHSRAPTLTHSPPSSAADLTALSREQAAAAFDRHDAPEEWLKDKARLAILSPPGFLVSASPAMLALFGAKDCEALEARLVQGDGPSARRLRHLAATLPIGEAPRLEQMRLVVDRRPASVNLHCVRIAGPGGASWLLVSVPALGAASDEPLAPAEAREAPQPEDDVGARIWAKSRRRMRPVRRRRIRASCGPSTRRAALARRIPCSSPRLGPTRPIAASRSRLSSAASDWIAATNSSACLASGKPFPASASSGRSQGLIGAG